MYVYVMCMCITYLLYWARLVVVVEKPLPTSLSYRIIGNIFASNPHEFLPLSLSLVSKKLVKGFKLGSTLIANPLERVSCGKLKGQVGRAVVNGVGVSF